MSDSRLTAAELDEMYTALGYGLTERGIEETPMILARLTLLLMHEVGDRAVIERAIGEALRYQAD
jgi:hypothetical protein